MKKLIIINISLIMMIHLLPVQTLNAAILTDINGAYVDLGDEGSVTGAGITFLWDMPRYFDSDKVLFYINAMYASGTENSDEPSETVRTYTPASAGIEYRYQVLQIPLYITGSAGGGVSYFKKEGPLHTGPFIDPSKTQIDTAFGPYADMMLGFNYVLSQNIAFFSRAGYQISFYNDDEIESPAGFQLNAGLRYSLSGSHRDLGGVDDWYEDSEPVKSMSRTKRGKSSVYMGFSPGIIIPIGEFGDMFKPAFGGMIDLTRRNTFFNSFEAGIAAGIYAASGRDMEEENGRIYDKFMMIPLLIKTGYRIKPANAFSVIPSISVGSTFISFEYKKIDTAALNETDESVDTIDPTVKAGLGLEYNITGSVSILMLGEYGILIEESGPFNFAAASAGLEFRF